MRRLIRPRSLSTRPPISLAMSPSSLGCRSLCPAVGGHQLCPAAVEPAVVAFTVAVVAGPGAERLIVALVAEPHLVGDRIAPGDDAAPGQGTALPVVHVVLLEGAGRAEHADASQPDRLLDLGRRRLVDKAPGPDLGLVGPARVPHPEGARSRPQQREIREDGADNRL